MIRHQCVPHALQGIVVKVINKSLGEKFYKKKGVVEVRGVVYAYMCRILIVFQFHILAKLTSC